MRRPYFKSGIILALAVAVVLAGSGVALAASPGIDSLALQAYTGSDWVNATGMTPLVEARLSIVISDGDTTDDIRVVEVHVRRTGTLSTGWDCDEHAIFSWAWDGTPEGTWSMGNGSASTTWALGAGSTGDCSASTSGTWYLYFTPGQLSVFAFNGWEIQARVRDTSGTWVESTLPLLDMLKFISLSADPATANFGSIDWGQYKEGPYVETRIVSNGIFDLMGSVASPWITTSPNELTLGPTGNPGVSEFSLAAGTTLSGDPPAIGVPQWLSVDDSTLTSGLARTETSPGDSETGRYTLQDVYFGMELGPSGVNATYGGTINVTAVNADTDMTAPAVISTTPADGAQGVDEATTEISVTYNEEVVVADYSLITVNGVPCQSATSSSGGLVTISPAVPLAANTVYTVEIGAGAITDDALIPNECNYFSFNFATTDTIGPYVSTSDPVNGATGVSNTTSLMTVTFNEPLQLGSGTVTIYDGTIRQVCTTAISTTDNTVLEISGFSLTDNHSYKVTINEGAVTDQTGNPCGPATISFSTTDTMAPSVMFTNPADGAVDVPSTTEITITFDEEVVVANYLLITINGEACAGATAMTGGVVMIYPASALADGTSYTVVIGAGAITDTAGNPCDECSFTFTTILGQNPLSITEKKVAAGMWHSLAVKPDGTVWAWGSNSSGELGDGSTNYNPNPSPVQVSGLTDVEQVAAGTNFSVALKSDGAVYAWGANYAGQLGDGTGADSTTPVQVSGLADIVAVSAGDMHTMALRSDGTVWTWGYNLYGQLGDGTSGNFRLAPVQVFTATSFLDNVVAISAGGYHCLALKSDGTVWVWGYNNLGQLGDNSTTNLTRAEQVSALSNVAAVGGGAYHSLAAEEDGTFWAWGSNNLGQLGDGSTTDRHTPTQISGPVNPVSLSGGGEFSLELESRGTIKAWGNNNNGQLGDGAGGTGVTSSVPVEVAGLTDAWAISAGWYHSLAVDSAGRIWSWGWNNYGQLGDGTTIPGLAPLLVDFGSVGVVGAEITATNKVVISFDQSIGFVVDGDAFVSGVSAQSLDLTGATAGIGASGDAVEITLAVPVSTDYAGGSIQIAADLVQAGSITNEPWLGVITDRIIPTAVRTNPSNGAAVDTDITVTFSENVSASPTFAVTLNGTPFDFISPGGDSYTLVGSILNINPASDLSAGTEYTVVIPSGAVADAAGNTDEYSFSFWTAGTAVMNLVQDVPASVNAGEAITPGPIVSLTDGGVPVLGIEVTAVMDSGSFAAGSVTSVATGSAGTAAFDNLIIEGAGAHSITFSAAGTSTGSSAFDVLPVAASQLAVSLPPTGGSGTGDGAPANIGAVTVEARDMYGNPSTIGLPPIQNVTASLALSPAGAFLDGTLTQGMGNVSGEATFSDLTVDKDGSYTVTFASDTLGSATTDPFVMTDIGTVPGVMSMSQQPGDAVAGSPLTTAPSVNLSDGGVPAQGVTVYAALDSGDFTADAVVTATTGVDGTATFDNLAVETAGTHTLIFSASGFESAWSASFNVSPAAASQMAITQQPTGGTGSPAAVGTVSLETQDAYGNPSTNGLLAEGQFVTVALGYNQSGGTLGNTATLDIVSGTVDFTGLTLDVSGTYTLVFASISPVNLGSIETNSFDINATPSDVIT